MSKHEHETVFGVNSSNHIKNKSCHKCSIAFIKGDIIKIVPKKAHHKLYCEKLLQ